MHLNNLLKNCCLNLQWSHSSDLECEITIIHPCSLSLSRCFVELVFLYFFTWPIKEIRVHVMNKHCGATLFDYHLVHSSHKHLRSPTIEGSYLESWMNLNSCSLKLIIPCLWLMNSSNLVSITSRGKNQSRKALLNFSYWFYETSFNQCWFFHILKKIWRPLWCCKRLVPPSLLVSYP